jgi:predicted metal-dependent RNase
MVAGGSFEYLEEYIDKPETTVILVDYQGEGTRGQN